MSFHNKMHLPRNQKPDVVTAAVSCCAARNLFVHQLARATWSEICSPTRQVAGGYLAPAARSASEILSRRFFKCELM